VIYRVYSKALSEDGFRDLQKHPEKGKWWHDSQCQKIPAMCDLSAYITGVFRDDSPSKPATYPMLVCAEVCY